MIARRIQLSFIAVILLAFSCGHPYSGYTSTTTIKTRQLEILDLVINDKDSTISFTIRCDHTLEGVPFGGELAIQTSLYKNEYFLHWFSRSQWKELKNDQTYTLSLVDSTRLEHLSPEVDTALSCESKEMFIREIFLEKDTGNLVSLRLDSESYGVIDSVKADIGPHLGYAVWEKGRRISYPPMSIRVVKF